MKAFCNYVYGLPDSLQLVDIPVPKPKENEVLIRVCSTSVNSWDWDFLVGKPSIYRLIFGVFKPKINILGCDIAGIVEEVGEKVERFKPGDRVFGDNSSANWGGFAEYACMPEKNLELLPEEMSFDEAAAFPQAGILALQGISEGKTLQNGDKVLLIGAAGGVGTFALQMAKNMKAHVTAIDRGDKLEFLSKLGADCVIDFQKEDFSKQNQKYDLILDVVARKPISAYKKALKPNGHLHVVGGLVKRLVQIAFFGSLMASKDQKIKLVIHKPNQGLQELIRQHQTGELRPIIDKKFKLEEIPTAMQYIGDGNVKGKIVVKVADL